MPRSAVHMMVGAVHSRFALVRHVIKHLLVVVHVHIYLSLYKTPSPFRLPNIVADDKRDKRMGYTLALVFPFLFALRITHNDDDYSTFSIHC